MIDIEREIKAEQRSVGTGPLGDGEGRVVRIRRSYDSPIEDVWEALTTPERISRWFLPISGDYRLGGRLPAGGQRRRRDPRMRPATPSPGDLGLRRDGRCGPRL